MPTSPPTPDGFCHDDGADPASPRGAVSRRTLLKGAAASAAMTAGGSRLAAAAPGRQAADQVDVAVVGAGLAGLTAAWEIAKVGWSVVVLETQGRVGGRMLRQQVGPDAYADLGGQWVGPTQLRILALAEELCVQRSPWYHTGATRFIYGDIDTTFNGTFCPFEDEDPPVPPAELEDAKRAWAFLDTLARTVPPEAPWTARGAKLLDLVTLDSWLNVMNPTPFARFAITNMARIGGSGAFEPGEVSLLHFAFTQSASPQREGPETALFYGAAGQIPELLHQELGEQVVLNATVDRIEQNDSGVVLHTPGRDYRARYAIVAIPPIRTADITYVPPMPPERLRLVQQMPMGVLVKCHAIYPTAFWRHTGPSIWPDLSGIAITDLPTTAFTADSSPPSGTPGILTTFIAGDVARDYLQRTAAQRRAAVFNDFVRCFGEGAADRNPNDPSLFIEADWTDVTGIGQGIGGAFTAYTHPGAWTSYGAALRPPVGRIHWAGTETATRWPGYFDGAVQSGEEAADAVLAQLGGARRPRRKCELEASRAGAYQGGGALAESGLLAWAVIMPPEVQLRSGDMQASLELSATGQVIAASMTVQLNAELVAGATCGATSYIWASTGQPLQAGWGLNRDPEGMPDSVDSDVALYIQLEGSQTSTFTGPTCAQPPDTTTGTFGFTFYFKDERTLALCTFDAQSRSGCLTAPMVLLSRT